ncbi:uncharacterized protein LOC128490674 [Spea bombifrons]|uniref:uncharacterized protein LOC128490674 n=1 Tax=Spea bombifrons TaxID=233779 RepID=UPI0023497524|nr:uncharacterized protein LOC128490674 [Spea bombifrons]
MQVLRTSRGPRDPGATMFLHRCLQVILLTLLWPKSGFSQIGVNIGKRCTYNKLKTCPSALEFNTYLRRVKSYEVCPDNHFIKFVFPNGNIYGQKTDGWARDIMRCIDIGTGNCLNSADFGFKSGCSNEAKGKPVPSSLPRTSTTPQTTTYEQPPLETTPSQPGLPVIPEDHSVTPGGHVLLPTGPADTSPEAKDRDNGSEKQQNPNLPPPDPKVVEKMKSMTIAVVSLILFSLVLVATITGIYCRKRKKEYTRAPENEPEQSEDGSNL